MLTAEEKVEIAEAVVCALDARRAVTEQDHAQHHAYIKKLIAREVQREEFWHDLRRHVAKWGAVSVLSAAIYGLWLAAKQNLLGP
jgi:hypothetical protein